MHKSKWKGKLSKWKGKFEIFTKTVNINMENTSYLESCKEILDITTGFCNYCNSSGYSFSAPITKDTAPGLDKVNFMKFKLILILNIFKREEPLPKVKRKK